MIETLRVERQQRGQPCLRFQRTLECLRFFWLVVTRVAHLFSISGLEKAPSQTKQTVSAGFGVLFSSHGPWDGPSWNHLDIAVCNSSVVFIPFGANVCSSFSCFTLELRCEYYLRWCADFAFLATELLMASGSRSRIFELTRRLVARSLSHASSVQVVFWPKMWQKKLKLT